MPIDMTKYLGLFVSETREHLEAFSRDLVLLEKEKNRDTVNALFRHAHSVKGMAASMGFRQITALAHQMEDLVDQLRIDPHLLDGETADLLFAASDQMQSLVNLVGSGHPESDSSPLVARLSRRLQGLTGKTPSTARVQDAFVLSSSELVLPPSNQTKTNAYLPLPGTETARTVRIKTELLDYFLDTAGELLLSASQIRELVRVMPETERGPVDQGLDRLRSLIKGLHDKVISARMTPLSVITNQLPRSVRDMARKMDRQIDLVLAGTDIELDRAIVDEIADPLMHLLRNAIDHGLESSTERIKAGKPPLGRITVAARRERERVVLEIIDDGRGMNATKLKGAAVKLGLLSEQDALSLSDAESFQLCCLPAVSTASRITDVSGRGVGMDAVQRAIEKVGGTLAIDSKPGQGTRFTLGLPFSVAVVNVLLVGVGQEVFGLPITQVKTVIEVPPVSFSVTGAIPVVSYGGSQVPAYSLGELLQIGRSPPQGKRPYLILDSGAGTVAIEIDRLLGHEETVLKSLSKPLDLIPGLAGATILGSGRPIFILDCSRLIR